MYNGPPDSYRLNSEYPIMFERLVFSPVRAVLILLWGGIALSIVAAPYLATHSYPGTAAFLYLGFSPVCHQLPARSFKLMGACWAVCQRCSGIYVGLFAGSFLPCINRVIPPKPRKLVFVATALLTLDALLPLIGIWNSTTVTRFVTGLFFGTMLSMLLLAGMTEFLRERVRQRKPFRSSSIEGVKL